MQIWVYKGQTTFAILVLMSQHLLAKSSTAHIYLEPSPATIDLQSPVQFAFYVLMSQPSTDLQSPAKSPAQDPHNAQPNLHLAKPSPARTIYIRHFYSTYTYYIFNARARSCVDDRIYLLHKARPTFG